MIYNILCIVYYILYIKYTSHPPNPPTPPLHPPLTKLKDKFTMANDGTGDIPAGPRRKQRATTDRPGITRGESDTTAPP